MSLIHVYYRYFSDGSPFYYDPSNGESTFGFPSDGIVLDPETQTPIDNIDNPDYQLMISEFRKLLQKQQESDIVVSTAATDQRESVTAAKEEQKESDIVVSAAKEEQKESDIVVSAAKEVQKESDIVVSAANEVQKESDNFAAPQLRADVHAEDDTGIRHRIRTREPRMQRRDLLNHHRSHCFAAPPLAGVLENGLDMPRQHRKHKKRSRTPEPDGTEAAAPAAAAPAQSILLDVPAEVANFDEKKAASGGAMKRMKSFMPDEKAPYLPSDIQENIHKFQVVDYAKQYFRAHRVGRIFNRKLVSLDQITQFSKDPLEFPLIRMINPSDEKNAVKCFKLILGYSGVVLVKGNPTVCAEQIVQILTNNPSLYDEVYFQLIKQTRKNPNVQWELKTWELFLIISTIFPSSRNSENWIKSHLAQNINSENKTIAEFAQLSYIRFSARCAIGKPKTNLELNYSVKIPKQIIMDYCPFVSSVYEHLWFQRKTYPNVKIPIIVDKMANAIIEKGAEKLEGIFRLPGNMKSVQDMIANINNGQDPLKDAKLYDVLSLFKQWFRDLPNPTCPVDSLPYLKTAHETQTYLDFIANHLPSAHLNLLGYLIGFLQRLAKASDVTKMNSKNLAIVFAPNIVQPSVDFNEPNQIKEYSDISINFVKFLIDNWDVSDFYPLK